MPPDAPTATVSVDVLALRLGQESGEVELLVHTRGHAPFRGRLALPGVLLARGERISRATVRALAKTGVRARDVRASGQLIAFDEANRDPRGPTLSIAVWAVLDPEVSLGDDARWVPLSEVPPLAFDHNRIVTDVVPIFAVLVWRDLEFSAALTGPTFPIFDAIRITASLTGREPDRANLNRQLGSIAELSRVEGETVRRGAGRPGAVWSWS